MDVYSSGKLSEKYYFRDRHTAEINAEGGKDINVTQRGLAWTSVSDLQYLSLGAPGLREVSDCVWKLCASQKVAV